jgi:hypothetical protein
MHASTAIPAAGDRSDRPITDRSKLSRPDTFNDPWDFALLLHHDDAAREAAYDREFRLSPLSEALDKAQDYGITVVSMKRDWNVVF